MTIKRKIITWTLVAILSVPAFLVFNHNEETVYINFIGIAYAWLTVKIHRYILPQWMVDYLHEDIDLDDEFDD